MQRTIRAALLALVLAVAVGCGGGQNQDGPRLANPEQADPRLKSVGAGPAVKANGVGNRVALKAQ